MSDIIQSSEQQKQKAPDVGASGDDALTVEHCGRARNLIGFHFAHGGLPNANGLGGGGKTAELPVNV
jgi:hypothetical protein